MLHGGHEVVLGAGVVARGTADALAVDGHGLVARLLRGPRARGTVEHLGVERHEDLEERGRRRRGEAPQGVAVEGPKSAKLVLGQPLGELGERCHPVPELIAEQVDGRHFEFSVERALFAMVANRCCAPSSKRYCHEQWLAEDVRIERCESLELHHLYRAMDFLEAHKEAIEEGLYFRIADLLNLDVELMFYDTTSLHFEVDEDDVGVGEDERVRARRRPVRRRTGRYASGASRRTVAGMCRRWWWVLR